MNILGSIRIFRFVSRDCGASHAPPCGALEGFPPAQPEREEELLLPRFLHAMCTRGLGTPSGVFLTRLTCVCLPLPGAALGPLLAGLLSPSGWNNVFYMLMFADACALLVSLSGCRPHTGDASPGELRASGTLGLRS